MSFYRHSDTTSFQPGYRFHRFSLGLGRRPAAGTVTTIIIGLALVIWFARPIDLYAVTKQSTFDPQAETASGIGAKTVAAQPMTAITAVLVQKSPYGPVITIQTDGAIPIFSTRVLDSPTRLAIDLFCTATAAETKTTTIAHPPLKSITITTYGRQITALLGLDGEAPPPFTTTRLQQSLSVFFKTRAEPEAGIQTEPGDESGAQILFGAQGTPPDIMPQPAPEDADKLTGLAQADQGPDGVKQLSEEDKRWRETVGAYNDRKWIRAVAGLREFVEAPEDGPYSEKAAFLLPRAKQQLHAKNQKRHFPVIKAYYEQALVRFPESEFAAEARLALADLLFTAGNLTEASVNYNMLIRRSPDTSAARLAMLQKARILRKRQKPDKALATLKKLIAKKPSADLMIKAKIETARILYEQNHFKNSLQTLSRLDAGDPRISYRFPQISLFKGNNQFQLRQFAAARDNLFRYYNAQPERDGNHMILAKIGDCYREAGHVADATKLYRLVLKLFPKTEGALISMLRLAEQQEKGELVPTKKKRSWRSAGSPNSPKAIYESIITDLGESDPKNPLIQLTMLKLALLHQKEGRPEEGLAGVKQLLSQYPQTELKKELRDVMSGTISTLMEKAVAAGDDAQAWEVYRREKRFIETLNSPELFLIMARLAQRSGDRAMAVVLYSRCDELMMEIEKPADLRLFMAQVQMEKGEYKKALAGLDFLVGEEITRQEKFEAYRLSSQIYTRQKAYSRAVEMLTVAQGLGLPPCEQMHLLWDKLSLFEIQKKTTAVKRTAGEIWRLNESCQEVDRDLLKATGEVLAKYADHKLALAAFEMALTGETDPERQIRVKIQMARTYEALKQKKAYRTLYEEIAQSDDPFWSNFAKERLEQIRFEGDIMKRARQLS